MAECAVDHKSSQLRHLFTIILAFSQPSDPAALWEAFKQPLSDSFAYKLRREISDHPDAQAYINAASEQLALSQIDSMLRQCNLPTSLAALGIVMPDLPPCPTNLPEQQNINPAVLAHASLLVQKEVDAYDAVRSDMSAELHADIATLTDEQLAVYTAVMEAVRQHAVHDRPCIAPFFLHSVGGCGKTWLLNLMLKSARTIDMPAGRPHRAAGGMTAHSTFKLSLHPTGDETSALSKLSDMAHLLQQRCSLIVIDEVTMLHTALIDQVDRTLRDICPDSNLPFGGMPVVLAGDFGQTLPIVRHGGELDQAAASLSSGTSPIWLQLRHFILTQNMRVRRLIATNDSSAQRLEAWEQHLLDVRDGTLGPAYNIPPHMQAPAGGISALLQWVFGDLPVGGPSDEVLQRAILTPLRRHVHAINHAMYDLLPIQSDTHQRTYIAADELAPGSEAAAVSPDVMATLQPDGLPTHTLPLKVGMPVMMLRNICGVMGLANGTRLRVTALLHRCIQCRILTGNKSGNTVLIPRIALVSDQHILPFQITRLQLPVQPCFGMTINKAQGQTLQRAGLWLPVPVFSHGQLYVALSRTGDPDNIRVLVEHGHSFTAPTCAHATITVNIVTPMVLDSLRFALRPSAPAQ
jgi:hypothetical protein